MIYRHNKTGNLYQFLGIAIDCTNSRNGTRVVFYVREPVEDLTNTKIFVREESEFFEKFAKVESE
jgi:hypothetical protein